MCMKQTFSLCKLSLFCILLLATLHCQAGEKETLQYAAKEIVSGLYMLEGVGGFTGGNIALSVGDEGVVMIDDGIPAALDIINTTVKSLTGKPVDFLINTHFHWDHAGNNGAMAKSGARIFAHENARKRLRAEPGKEKNGELPVFTFSQQMRFYLNGNDTQLVHVANAHTDGDIIVHFKSLNVVHTGDVYVNGVFPYIDIDNGGSITGMIAAQHQILVLTDAETKIIPGHGKLATRSDLEASVAMLEESKKRIAGLIVEKKTEEEVIALNPLSDYRAWSGDFITLEAMTRQVYESLVGGL